MTHPITPPPELVEQWMQSHSTKYDLARQAAQWGANQELEACCKVLEDELSCFVSTDLRAARRPKPPSLKEQALALINGNKSYLDDTAMDIIRRALEALPND
jgi:hypothetical protein